MRCKYALKLLNCKPATTATTAATVADRPKIASAKPQDKRPPVLLPLPLPPPVMTAPQGEQQQPHVTFMREVVVLLLLLPLNADV